MRGTHTLEIQILQLRNVFDAALREAMNLHKVDEDEQIRYLFSSSLTNFKLLNSPTSLNQN